MGFLDIFRSKPVAMVAPEPQWLTALDLGDTRSQELSPSLVTGFEASNGVSPPESFSDYQGLYGEGGDGWFHAAVAAVAQDVSNVRIHPVDWRAGEETDAWPHPSLEHPYPGISLPDLVELWVTDLLTTANAFAVIDTSGELNQIPPNQMRIYPDRLGHVHHYALVSRSGGREHFLEPERVVHFRLPNPSSRHWGTGPGQALRTSLLISDGESQFLVNFYQNGARPAGFIGFDPKVTAEQAKVAVDQFRQKYSGKRNHGKLGALTGGATYNPMSVTPVDGGLVEVRRLTLQTMLANIGVAPFRLFMLDDADYANAKQQERIYDLKTVIPWAQRRIVDKLNANQLLVPDPNRVRLGLDIAPILNMHRDEKAIAEAGAIAVNAGLLTRAEARKRGYGLGEIDADVPETGPIGALTSAVEPTPTEATTGAQLDDPEAVDRMTRARGHVRAILRNPATRAAHERSSQKRRDAQTSRIRRVVGPTLKAMSNEILAIVEGYRSHAPRTRDDAVIPQALIDALGSFDFGPLGASIEDTWMPEILRVLLEEGQIKTSLVGLDPETFSVSDPRVVEFVQEFGAAEVRHVTDATRDAIRDITAKAMADGESVDELAKRLRDSPEVGATRVRSDRIAQTESAAAAGFGTQEAYTAANEAGVRTLKQWLTVGDGNVRESHAANEAAGAIEADLQFPNGMRYPGDPSGGAAERINERCDMVPITEDAE